MSTTGAAGGRPAGSRRVAEADLPRAYSSRPDADPLKAFQYWGAEGSTPRDGTPRAPIVPEIPESPDPAEILRQLAALAVADVARPLNEVRVLPDPPVLPQRAEAPETPGVGDAPRRRRRRDRGDAPATPFEGVAAVASSEDGRPAAVDERIELLARLMPRLRPLAEDGHPELRALYALCLSMLAVEGIAQADREVWRTLLGLSKYDDDADVRAVADTALTDLERHGTRAQGEQAP